jgi:hypothetical protein
MVKVFSQIGSTKLDVYTVFIRQAVTILFNNCCDAPFINNK